MLHLAHELQPVHPRHGDVGDQQVGREMLQRLQRGCGVGGRLHLAVHGLGFFQYLFDPEQNELLVVYDQYAHGAASF